MTEENAADLRSAAIVSDRVRRIANRTFGFDPFQVVPLEADDDPSRYCMFEVCGIEYQVNDGELSIWRDESRR